MKIQLEQQKKRPQTGSVFLVTMGLVLLFALILGSYLAMVNGQADSVARAQNYNAAVPVAEAGIEEALAFVNKNYPAQAMDTTWSNTVVADGWTVSASSVFTKSNTVYSGNYYYVIISNASSLGPTITSYGVVPYTEYSWGLDGGGSNSKTSTSSLIRGIQVSTTSQGLFTAALAAKGDITFSGGANIDSYNSANPLYSSNGQYNAALKHDQATVGTDGRVVGAITTSGNVDVRGYVNTGPGGTVGFSGNVSIGDNNWVSNGTTGIEVSRSNDNFNVSFPDIPIPTATYTVSPASGTIGGTNYNMVFEGTQYWGASNVLYQTGINLSGKNAAIVTNGAVNLYIPSGSSFSFSGQSYIYIAPGSSLTIYCGASSASLSGQAMFGPTNAEDLVFYGLPTCTSVSYSGNADFMGVIYAPDASFSASGNGAVYGALVASAITFTGGSVFHYDENLGTIGATSGWMVNNWQEITPSSYIYSELSP